MNLLIKTNNTTIISSPGGSEKPFIYTLIFKQVCQFDAIKCDIVMTTQKNSILYHFIFTDCGGMVHVSPGKDVFVISPGYPAPYPLGKICRWGVKV